MSSSRIVSRTSIYSTPTPHTSRRYCHDVLRMLEAVARRRTAASVCQDEASCGKHAHAAADDGDVDDKHEHMPGSGMMKVVTSLDLIPVAEAVRP